MVFINKIALTLIGQINIKAICSCRWVTYTFSISLPVCTDMKGKKQGLDTNKFDKFTLKISYSCIKIRKAFSNNSRVTYSKSSNSKIFNSLTKSKLSIKRSLFTWEHCVRWMNYMQQTKFNFVFSKLTLNFMPTNSNNSIIETLKRAQNHKRNFGVLMVVILHRHLLGKLSENVWVLI